MPPLTATPEILEQIRRAFELANEYVISDIECNGRAVLCDKLKWYDVRGMLDERELSPQCIDMNRQALAYAEEAGLIERNAASPHLVRILRRGR